MLHYTVVNPGPFHRVILQSGSSTTRDCRPFDASIVEKYFEDFLTLCGCPCDLSADETFTHLRGLPLSVITDAQDTIFARYRSTMQWPFRPVIDGDIIRRPPLESWLNGNYYKVPIMTGFCTNEGSLYVERGLSRPEQFTRFMEILLPNLPKEDLNYLEELYPDPLSGNHEYQDDRVGDVIGPQYMRTTAAYGEYALIAPIRQTAHLASSQSNAPPVYLYHWDVFTTLYGGAAHADNLPYEVFDSSITSKSVAQKEVAGVFHAYITSFICHKGDPNAVRGRYGARPQWMPYSPRSPLTMILGKENRELIGGQVGVAAELCHEARYDKQCEFWWLRTKLTQA
jgi:carboxylesterase type B